MIPPICALCKLPMRPDPEAPGVWRCPDDETHEFHEDADAEPVTAQQRARRSKVHLHHGGTPCPRCRDTHMLEVQRLVGVWRCPSFDSHEFMAGEKAGAEQPRPKLEPTGKTALMVIAAPYWLAHLGLTGPILWAPQCNITDGRRCLLTGPVAHGGGSKSGRSRKKGDKGGKKFTDSPWGEGGTNAK